MTILKKTPTLLVLQGIPQIEWQITVFLLAVFFAGALAGDKAISISVMLLIFLLMLILPKSNRYIINKKNGGMIQQEQRFGQVQKTVRYPLHNITNIEVKKINLRGVKYYTSLVLRDGTSLTLSGNGIRENAELEANKIREFILGDANSWGRYANDGQDPMPPV